MKNNIPPILYSRHHGSCENDSLPQQQVQQIKENMTTPADNGKCRFMGQVRKSEVIEKKNNMENTEAESGVGVSGSKTGATVS